MKGKNKALVPSSASGSSPNGGMDLTNERV